MKEKILKQINQKINESIAGNAGSQIPSSISGMKLAAPVYAKKQKRNRMAKKSRAINRKK